MEAGGQANENQYLLQLPLKTRISLLAVRTATDVSSRRDGTVNRLLFRLGDFIGFKRPAQTGSGPVKTSDITVDPSRNLWFRLYVPTQSHADTGTGESLPVVFFFHGGGFVFLSPDFKYYDAVCCRMARKLPAVLVSVNYRLAPEHPYPAQYDDGFDVLKFVDEQRLVLPKIADVSRCFLAGDSAGGNIAHHLAIRCDQDIKFTRLQIIGVVAIQPFFGGEERTSSDIELAKIEWLTTTERTDWMWNAFIPAGSGMDRDHEVINVSGPNARDISGINLPPILVVLGGFDSLKDWQRRYYEWLKKSGKEAYLLEYPNMFHAFYIFSELPESGKLIDEIKNFMYNKCSTK